MEDLVSPDIDQYAAEHSAEPGALLAELEQYTYDHFENAQMVVGRLEGALLKMLVRLTGARRILEIGLFTGYSSLAMAEAMEEGGRIVSCELKEEHAEVARSFFKRSPVGDRIEIRMGPAIESLETIEGPFDLAFIDADKENYPNYYDRVLPKLRSGGLLVADNVLWSGNVLDPKKDSDHALVVFNDKVHNDPNVEHVLLTVRDGVMLARKV
ncbi:MAG: class I SAM-dependent methyltransferase [Arenicellales bacterium]